MLRGLDSGLTVVDVSRVGHCAGESMLVGTGPSWEPLGPLRLELLVWALVGYLTVNRESTWKADYFGALHWLE